MKYLFLPLSIAQYGSPVLALLPLGDQPGFSGFIRCFGFGLLLLASSGSLADRGDGIIDPGENETAELARAAQNPIASMISLPFQNNTDFNFGPEDKTFNTLNIQPVLPFQLGDNWNVVTRTIVPVVSQPGIAPGESRETGLGDTTLTAWVAPSEAGQWIWGVGPVALLPTNTDKRLGADEWGAGASVVLLTMRGKWVVGTLVNNVWDIDGDTDINQLTWQYFINYNLDNGWYLASSPIVTANWEATSKDKWTVPFGGGIGRVFRIGSQAVNTQLHYYYNVEKPELSGDWSIRFQFQFMFPKYAQ